MKNESIAQILDVVEKLEDEWPDDTIPASKGRRYAKEIRDALGLPVEATQDRNRNIYPSREM